MASILWINFLVIIIVLIFGLISYYKPIIGLIGIGISIIILLPNAINPQFVIGTSELNIVTVVLPEIRLLNIFVTLICCGFTISGLMNNIGD